MTGDKDPDARDLKTFLELRNLNHISDMLYYIYYHLLDKDKKDSIEGFKSSFDTQMSIIGGIASIVTVVAFFQTVDDVYKILLFATTIVLIIGLFVWRQIKSKKIEGNELAKLDDTLQLAICIGQIMHQSSEILLLSKLNNKLHEDDFMRSLLLESYELLRTSIMRAEEIASRLEKNNQLDNTLENIQYNRELLIERIASARSIVVKCHEIIMPK